MITEGRLRLVIRSKITALIQMTDCEYSHIYGRLDAAVPGDGREVLLERSKLLTKWRQQMSAGTWWHCQVCTSLDVERVLTAPSSAK